MNGLLRWAPQSASNFADGLDALSWFLMGVSAFFSILVIGLIIFFAIKYHRKSEDEIGTPVPSPLWIEVTWSVIPLIIALIAFAWGTKTYLNYFNPPEDTLNISAIGRQWMWKFQHPDGRREINTLRVPVGKNIKLTMISQDVIHSFYAPDFRVKMDVLPGRYTATWFRPTKTGTYFLFCAEYCGTDHSQMRGSVIVMEPEAYKKWASYGEDTPADLGESLFRTHGCASCHSEQGTGPGPKLEGLFGSKVIFEGAEPQVADEAYIRESILFPQKKVVKGHPRVMPSYQGRLSEDQVMALVSYIRSLANEPKGGEE